MLHFFARLLGWRCCGEWTQWERKSATYERPTDFEIDGIMAITHTTIRFTKQWQERKCTLCGRVEQLTSND